MRAALRVQRTEAKAQSATTWCGTELVCAAVQQEKNTEQCGYDHAPVTRGHMRAQFLLPHGPCVCGGNLGDTTLQTFFVFNDVVGLHVHNQKEYKLVVDHEFVDVLR